MPGWSKVGSLVETRKAEVSQKWIYLNLQVQTEVVFHFLNLCIIIFNHLRFGPSSLRFVSCTVLSVHNSTVFYVAAAFLDPECSESTRGMDLFELC
jgi:hypothetical protein